MSPVVEQTSGAGFDMAQNSLVLDKMSSFGIDGLSSPVLFQSPNLTGIGEGFRCRRARCRAAVFVKRSTPFLPYHNTSTSTHLRCNIVSIAFTSSISFFQRSQHLHTLHSTAQTHPPPCENQAVNSLMTSQQRLHGTGISSSPAVRTPCFDHR